MVAGHQLREPERTLSSQLKTPDLNQVAPHPPQTGNPRVNRWKDVLGKITSELGVIKNEQTACNEIFDLSQK